MGTESPAWPRRPGRVRCPHRLTAVGTNAGRALVATLLVASAACGGSGAPPPLVADSVWSDGPAWGVVVVGDAIWASDPSRAALVALDGEGTASVVPTGAADPRVSGLAIGADRLWIADLGGEVLVADLESGEVSDRVDVGPGEPADLVVVGDRVWVPLHGEGGELVALDVDSLQIVERVALTEPPFAIEADGEVLWVAGLERQVFTIDARSGQILDSVDVGASPRGLALAGASAWVTLAGEGAVVEIDRESMTVERRVGIGGEPWPIAADEETLWVADTRGQLVEVDTDDGIVRRRVSIPAAARGVTSAGGAAWVATMAGGVVRVSEG